MKAFKFISILLLAAMTFVIQPVKAQTATVYFTEIQWYRTFTDTTAADTILGTTEVGKSFFVNKTDGYNYIYQSTGVRRNTTGDGTFTLYGSIDGVKYYSLGTKTWHTSTADTTVYFTDTTTVGWRFMKTTLKGTASGTALKLGPQKLALFRLK